MTEHTLVLLKDKIIKTDAVIQLLSEKNSKVNQLQVKLKFLFERYVEKSKEAEALNQKVCVCIADHEPLKLRVDELEYQYLDLQTKYDEFLNSSELKFQVVSQELDVLKKKNEELLKANARLRHWLSRHATKEKKTNNIREDEIDVLRKENQVLSNHVNKLTERCEKESKKVEKLTFTLSDSHKLDEDVAKVHSKEIEQLTARYSNELSEINKRVSILEMTEKRLRKENTSLIAERINLNNRLVEQQLENHVSDTSSEVKTGIYSLDGVPHDVLFSHTDSRYDMSDTESVGSILKEMLDLPRVLTPFNDCQSSYDETEGCSELLHGDGADNYKSHTNLPISEGDEESSSNFTQCQTTSDNFDACIYNKSDVIPKNITNTIDKRLDPNCLPNRTKVVTRQTSPCQEIPSLEMSTKTNNISSRKRRYPILQRKRSVLYSRALIKRLKMIITRDIVKYFCKSNELMQVSNNKYKGKHKSAQFERNKKLLRLKIQKLRELNDTSDTDGERNLVKLKNRKNFKRTSSSRNIYRKSTSVDDAATIKSGAQKLSEQNSAQAKYVCEYLVAKKPNTQICNGIQAYGHRNPRLEVDMKSDFGTIGQVYINSTCKNSWNCMDDAMAKPELSKHNLCAGKSESEVNSQDSGYARSDVDSSELELQMNSNFQKQQNDTNSVDFNLSSSKMQSGHYSRRHAITNKQRHSGPLEKKCNNADDADSVHTCNGGTKRIEQLTELFGSDITDEDESQEYVPSSSLMEESVSISKSICLIDEQSSTDLSKSCVNNSHKNKRRQCRSNLLQNSPGRIHEKVSLTGKLNNISLVESRQDIVNHDSSVHFSSDVFNVDSPRSPEYNYNLSLSPPQKVTDLPERITIYDQINYFQTDSKVNEGTVTDTDFHVTFKDSCPSTNLSNCFDATYKLHKQNCNDAPSHRSGVLTGVNSLENDVNITCPDPQYTHESITETHECKTEKTVGTSNLNSEISQRIFKRPNCASSIKRNLIISSPLSPPIVPIRKKQKISSGSARQLFQKLLNFGNEPTVVEQVARRFADQDKNYVASLVLTEVCLYTCEKIDMKYTPPAPLLTQAQRLLLGFMYKLEKSCMPGLLECFVYAAETALLTESDLKHLQPVTRLYVAVCKLEKDVDRMRRMICDALYFMGDFVVPFLFTVLSTWFEALPLQIDSSEDMLVKVLIQVINLKTCNKPGYNLLPLRNLLHAFYGFPMERWNSDEVFRDVFQKYIGNPTKSLEYSILILCKNQSKRWVFQQIKTHVKDVITNSKSLCLKVKVATLVEHIISQYNRDEEDVDTELLKTWLQLCVHDATPFKLKESIENAC